MQVSETRLEDQPLRRAPSAYAEDLETGNQQEIVPEPSVVQAADSEFWAARRLTIAPGQRSAIRLRTPTLLLNAGLASPGEYRLHQGPAVPNLPAKSLIFLPNGASFQAQWELGTEVSLLALAESLLPGEALQAPAPTLHFRAKRLEKFMANLFAELDEKDFGHEVASDALARLIAVELARTMEKLLRYPPGQESLTPRQVRAMESFIQGNLHRDLSLTEMGAHINLSRAHFARAFKRSVGIPPARYMREQRLAAASHLLATTTEAIHDIAFRTGFTTASHFAEQFRKHTGLAPSEYRRLRSQT
ncbi:helix-turn-helix domain-containing protein [Nostoc sp. NIES-2111]